uniref:Uncharacterized protein n=1 Tax=Aegilops tauschii subsp. strangulata TaxID=200361 RepID=A0A453APC8_AEGTS
TSNETTPADQSLGEKKERKKHQWRPLVPPPPGSAGSALRYDRRSEFFFSCSVTSLGFRWTDLIWLSRHESRAGTVQVYPIFAATGVAVSICAMQLIRNITTNPEVRYRPNPNPRPVSSAETPI